MLKWLSETLTATVAVGLVAAFFVLQWNPVAPDYTEEMLASVMVMGDGGSGSGTLIAPDKVLTARHVARGGLLSSELVVKDIYGNIYKVVDAVFPDKQVDAAVLILEKPVVGLAVAGVSCRLPALGEHLVNVGNPYGVLQWFVAQAWVSSYESDYKAAKLGDEVKFNGLVLFQGVSIGGQSGSGFFDENGDVVGVLVIGIGDPGRSHESVDPVGGFVATNFICDWLTKQVQTEELKA